MAVFISFHIDFFATPQQLKEHGETAASCEHANRFQDCCLADAVLSGEQSHASEMRDLQMVNTSESLDCQIRKVKGIAHCMLHPSGTKARYGCL